MEISGIAVSRPERTDTAKKLCTVANDVLLRTTSQRSYCCMILFGYTGTGGSIPCKDVPQMQPTSVEIPTGAEFQGSGHQGGVGGGHAQARNMSPFSHSTRRTSTISDSHRFNSCFFFQGTKSSEGKGKRTLRDGTRDGLRLEPRCATNIPLERIDHSRNRRRSDNKQYSLDSTWLRRSTCAGDDHLRLQAEGP